MSEPSMDAYTDVSTTFQGSTRFEMVETPRGHVVVDWYSTRAIAAGEATAHMRDVAYLLPHELRDAGVAFRRQRIADGRETYNGHLLGLDTNLGKGTDANTQWSLVRARYWDHIASDIFAMKERALYVDRRGQLRDFGESWLLNGIGTSVLALTTDACLVVIEQSSHNESSHGLLAPSGSGSLEPDDFQGESTLRVDELAAKGALRELSEEAGIARIDVTDTAFLGFGRWLEKSGKPELFTLALLSIDSHEVLRRQVPSADQTYTMGVGILRLKSETDAWAETDPHSILDADTDAVHLFSVPLLIGLHLVARAVGEDASPARELVYKALGTTAR